MSDWDGCSSTALSRRCRDGLWNCPQPPSRRLSGAWKQRLSGESASPNLPRLCPRCGGSSVFFVVVGGLGVRAYRSLAPLPLLRMVETLKRLLDRPKEPQRLKSTSLNVGQNSPGCASRETRVCQHVSQTRRVGGAIGPPEAHLFICSSHAVLPGFRFPSLSRFGQRDTHAFFGE